MTTPRRLSIIVGPEHGGKTVETLLRHVLQLSGSGVRRAKRIPDGITLDGERVYTNVVVKGGETLSVQVGDASPKPAVIPVPGAITIVYEDEDLLILDKEAPLPVHPSLGHSHHTLANFVMAYYQSIGLHADFHPVNRLDRGTSGLMVVAKHAYAHESLSKTLHSREFERQYLAICEGVPSPREGSLDGPIGRVPGAFLLREVRPDGAAALTHFRTLQANGERSLVTLRLDTGRTHQIRVHLSSIGCPIVGDFLYGKEDPAIPDRFALHAAAITLTHPITQQQLSFTSPLPPALSALLSHKQEEAGP